MTDAEDAPAPPATLLQRLVAAGIDEGRGRALIVEGAVRVQGEKVSDPDAPAPWPTPWVFAPT